MDNKTKTINGHTIKDGGYSSVKLQAKRDRKRREALSRQADYDKLTLKEKFDRLPTEGAKRQRAKLMKKLEQATKATAVKSDETTTKKTKKVSKKA